jgi:succinyl-diaminopimelate desuccinylase
MKKRRPFSMRKTSHALLLELAANRPVTAEVARVNATVVQFQRYLAAQGVQTAIEELDGRQILFASTVPGKSVDILLNAHLDVVPAEDAVFQLREEKGLLYGRGTHDCLGNCAVVGNLLVDLQGKASLGAVFSTDEEVGGATTKAMVDRGYTARRLVLVLDGSGYALGVAQKGILNARLIAHGRAGHAAYPWRGDNAIDRLVDGYAKVRSLFPPIQPPDEWHTSMAATLMQAGTVANRVPDLAEMTLNIRFTEPGDGGRLMEQLRAVSGLEVDGRIDCEPFQFSPDTPALKSLAAFMEAQLGQPVRIERMNGATDARHFAALGVPVAIIGIPGKDAHAETEHIDLAGMAAYETMLREFLETQNSALPGVRG